jgi:hypothetical protein
MTLTSRRTQAQAVTLTIAQSFNMAYELWQMTQSNKQLPSKSDTTSTITTKADTHNEDDADKPGK